MKKIKTLKQVAALPLYFGVDADNPLVFLISSRDSGRWVIPKGWPIKGKADHKIAEIEAFEEAGLTGKAAKQPIGTYHYQKRLPAETRSCTVSVYALTVDKRLRSWPEKNERKRRLCSFQEAAKLIDDKELGALFLRLDQKSNAKPTS